MKRIFAGLSLACLALAIPFYSPETANDGQVQLKFSAEDYANYPGYDLDLNELRLVQLEGREPVWMTEYEKIQLKAQGQNFFDITDAQELGDSESFATQDAVFGPLTHQDKVKSVIETLSVDGPKANLEKFTSFRTRYYRSDTGKQSQVWLQSKIDEVTSTWASKELQKRITTREFPHAWAQSSIITTINGTSSPDEIIVISAHQDSTNMFPFLPAPGADDDGSGTVTILEAYRALLASDFRPNRTVEFHWYSAEEAGLLGSQAVAKDYQARGIKVIAMSQFDMTAWVKRGTREEVGVITDFTNEKLTQFNKGLVEEYLSIPYVETKCGYACSDHASWEKAGYPAIFTIESSFANSNQHIHSASDRIDISDEFSFSHMLEFSKLAVAFAIELGGW